ncbi:hypothetical protein PWT90_03311 [Aphanocladium album]|nr:hypothetical protein PWT90_03311 [Aphanocladium album]
MEAPVRRPYQKRHPAAIVGAGLATSIVYFWAPFAVVSLNDTLPSRDFAGLLTIVISLALFLQAFLSYRLVSRLRLWPALTDALDTFFYERRTGSALLLLLCVPWCIVGCYALYFSIIGAAATAAHYHNPKLHGEGAMPPQIAGLGRPVELCFAFIVFTLPSAATVGIWWACRTALRAMYRVLRVEPGRGYYEGVPLGLDEMQPEEQRFQSNVQTGMRWGAIYLLNPSNPSPMPQPSVRRPGVADRPRSVTRISLFAAALACSTAYYWMPMKLACNQKDDPLVFLMQILVLMLEGCLCYGLLSASRAYPHITDIVDYIVMKTPAGHMFLGLLALCAWALGASSVSIMALFVAGKTKGTRHDPPPPEVAGMGHTERMIRIAAPFSLVYAACWLFCLASVGLLQIAPPRRRENGDLTWGDLLRRPAVAAVVLFIVMASRLGNRIVGEISS